MYLLLSQSGPVKVTVSVLKDWIDCRWGGEPRAQPAHSSHGEGEDGRWEKGGGTPVWMGYQTKRSGSRSSFFP